VSPVRPGVKWAVVAVAAALSAMTLAGGVDMVVLEHRLNHVAVRFPEGGTGETWLVVGSDERNRRGPRFAGHRADVILLVHVGAPGPSIISVPRDLLMRTEAGGVERAALAFDRGPQALVDGLCRTLGVAATHLVVVTMDGFADIVDALGGITVHLAAPVRDRKAQLEIDRAGAVHVSGSDALALVRSRRPEHLVDGVWVGTGEHAGARLRSRNAAAVFNAIRSRARGARHNPVTVQRTLWAATGAMTLDSGAGLTGLLALLNSHGRLAVLPAAPLPRTIALLANARTRAVLAAAGYPPTCTPHR
jgi:LCP family protein required for cell wall assembly